MKITYQLYIRTKLHQKVEQTGVKENAIMMITRTERERRQIKRMSKDYNKGKSSFQTPIGKQRDILYNNNSHKEEEQQIMFKRI